MKFFMILSILTITICQIYAAKIKRQDRVCPALNICGDGVCQVTTHPSYQYAYVCKCNDGTYRFEPCTSTIQTNPCASNPCRNSGVCDVLTSGYSCRCPQGFAGTNCEFTVSVCASRPCGNFPCLESPSFPNGYICQCATNVFQTSCAGVVATTTTTSTTPATTLCSDQSICKNQGVCYIVSGALRCVCAQGFTGLTCDTSTTISLTGCNPSPCKNFGNCVTDTSGTFRGCICPTGYSGTYCETQTSTSSACSSIACQNGGICQTNTNGNAVCTCKAGTTGSRCETVYFTCTKDGRFKDPYGCASGKYIECIYVGQTQVGLPNGILYIRDCPATLRYNPLIDQCDYAANVQC